MSDVQDHILQRLATGEPCSGEGLAAECGMSRAAVAKHVRQLRAAGWPIEARRGVGYRLAPGLSPLCREAIERELTPQAARVERLELCGEVDSTNSRAGQWALSEDGRARLCIAEHQSAGRGRRGRSWHARAGGGITFSLARRFEQPPSGLLGLALVAGVASAAALTARGVCGVVLKWPNDIQIGAAKLGGILVELAGESSGPTRAIVGLGINYDLADTSAEAAPNAIDVRRAAAQPPARSVLAGALMAALIDAFDRFEQEGLEPFLARWRESDVLYGRAVRLDAPDGVVTGTADGVDSTGALRLRTADGVRRFLSGDVSVRAAS